MKKIIVMLNWVKLAVVSFLLLFVVVGCSSSRPIKKANHKLMKVANEYELDGQEEFVIGEFQSSTYKVYLGNFEKTDLKIYVVNKESKKAAQHFVLLPNHTATVFVADFQMVIIQNPSKETVKVKIGYNKEVEGFRYQKIKEYQMGE
ncbi:hypothetical protein K6119_08765 [Paracrocinitomix mangrovi]|uniref:hypothetical protein n=1 Tax=Paracrocinitomix mangrovi TaxID=2862509 RepID=UPI001C8D23DD|nr:hypothetical protein [Paracrocinitomix mangrovi]UKN03602.1 hypothetical protein K6119_08765 [Paracrocinitomix mangrovi]